MATTEMQLRSLVALGRALEAVDGPGAAIATVAEAARGMLPFGACALVLPGQSGWSVWRAPAGRPEALTSRHDIPPEAAAVFERFEALTAPLRIDDLLTPPWNATAHRELLWKDGTRAALVLPLVAAQRRLGTLVFTAFRPDVYSAVDLAYIEIIAWFVAMAVRTAEVQHG